MRGERRVFFPSPNTVRRPSRVQSAAAGPVAEEEKNACADAPFSVHVFRPKGEPRDCDFNFRPLPLLPFHSAEISHNRDVITEHVLVCTLDRISVLEYFRTIITGSQRYLKELRGQKINL